MGTFLFDKIIFGPIRSRRLGNSLGINLLPVNKKICTFNCIYCECGWTNSQKVTENKLPGRDQIKKTLEKVLSQMQSENNLPDVLTFAGNGEPTLHPSFAEIIDDTIELRNKYTPECRIAVLSNATFLHNNKVFDSLKKVDENIQKLDSVKEKTIRLINCPGTNFNLNEVIEKLIQFKGKVIIQTLFLKGNFKGENFDNTTSDEINAWLKILQKINPQKVMIYSIERDTPVSGLQKIDASKLNEIGEKVRKAGIRTHISI